MCKKVQNNLYLKLLVLLFIISQAPLIGYPSGQDGLILRAWDVPRWSGKKKFSFGLYNKSSIDQAGWRWLYIDLVFLLGSLSSDVFEPRTSTGSGLFEQIFDQIVSKRVKTLSNTHLVAWRHIKSVAQKRHCLNSLSTETKLGQYPAILNKQTSSITDIYCNG